MKSKIFFGINRIFFCLTMTFLFASQIFSESKKNENVYIKYVHPRVYEFDLCDTENSVFLSYNPAIQLFDVSVDFSNYVQSDLPQAGDKVIFYYKGYATKDGGSVKATVTGDNGERITDEEKTFARDLKKNEPFDSNVSFVLNKNVQKNIRLYLYSTKQNRPGKIDQFYLIFKRVKKTTDTSKESLQEKKAAKKNIEIIEVKSEIKKDEDINAILTGTPNLSAQESKIEIETKVEIKKTEEKEKKEDKTIAKLELAQEKLKEIERKRAKAESEKIAREEAEKLRLAQERIKELERIQAEKEAEERRLNQEALEKALEQVKSGRNATYEKEFLNDYMIFDNATVAADSERNETIIENPDEKDSFGRTLLMKAAQSGNDWQISALLRSGANVNLKDNEGWTALMYAVRYQQSVSCVDLLINAGAEIKNFNNYGTSALMIASCYNDNPEIIKKLLSYYSINEKDVLKSLVLLLSENHTSEYSAIAKLNVFTDFSVPLNAFYEGKTPLMYAAEFGNSTKILKILTDNNALTSVRSSEGKTAFDYACENKNLKRDDDFWALNKN